MIFDNLANKQGSKPGPRKVSLRKPGQRRQTRSDTLQTAVGSAGAAPQPLRAPVGAGEALQVQRLGLRSSGLTGPGSRPAVLEFHPQGKLHDARIRQRLRVRSERGWLIQPVADRGHVETYAVGHVEHIAAQPRLEAFGGLEDF